MGIKHFSGLFVLLCIGIGVSILTTIGEHIVFRLVLPRIKKKSKLKYWLHTSQRLHRALNTSFNEEKFQQKLKRLERRCNTGNSQPRVWNTGSQSCNRRKYIIKEAHNELTFRHQQDLPLPHLRREPPKLFTAANGKVETLNMSRNSVVQELSELDKQIEAIKQELQTAMSRKNELEEFQRKNRTAES